MFGYVWKKKNQKKKISTTASLNWQTPKGLSLSLIN